MTFWIVVWSFERVVCYIFKQFNQVILYGLGVICLNDLKGHSFIINFS